MPAFYRVEIVLPDWVEAETATPVAGDTPEARMAWVLRLAELNDRHGTGGPFAAAVFGPASSQPVAVGLNVVLPAGQSLAHAEIMALALAQRAAGTHDLGVAGEACQLVTSTEPCAMCLGAVVWSGVRSLVCGARGADAEAAGFDEGPKPADWVAELERRGIAVHRDVLRREATALLRRYVDRGGAIYNPRRPA